MVSAPPFSGSPCRADKRQRGGHDSDKSSTFLGQGTLASNDRSSGKACTCPWTGTALLRDTSSLHFWYVTLVRLRGSGLPLALRVRMLDMCSANSSNSPVRSASSLSVSSFLSLLDWDFGRRIPAWASDYSLKE